MTRGEIWWADFGFPHGSEAGHTHPVIIVQDNPFNESKIKTIVVLNIRLMDAPGNMFVGKMESKLREDSVIIVAQLYALDRGRFMEKISKIESMTMKEVDAGLKLVLGIS